MPVNFKHSLKPLTEKQFHELDFKVMKWAFEIHNQLGRFYDEKIYKNRLIEICQRNGIPAETEAVIQLSHQNFSKNLYIDLLLQQGAIYELKAATAIVSDHRIQTLDYLFFTNLQYGKIINFRTPSVTYEFVSTGLNFEKRQKFSIHTTKQFDDLEHAQRLKSAAIALFKDWGLFLNTSLYKDALVHLLGTESMISPVPVKLGATILGQQNLPLLAPFETFCISSVTTNPAAYREHLQRFLNCTELRYLHWINLCRSNVYFNTLMKS